MRFEDALLPIPSTKAVTRKKFLTVDIESKKEDTQTAGFTRPFLVGVYDGEHYEEFRNEPHLVSRPWQERHILPGGCVDQTLNYLLTDKYRGYQIYAHNGGNFDHLFWLSWLKRHEDEYAFEVVPVQSSIQKVQVVKREEARAVFDAEEPKSGVRMGNLARIAQETPVTRKRKRKKKDVSSWTFLDSMKLFPTSLQKMLETFGLASKVQHDLHMHEDDPSWGVYLRRDCLGLYEALVRMHELLEVKLGGEIGMTAPATAMKLFRRRFLGRGEAPDNIPRHTHFSGCPSRGKRPKDNEPLECSGCCHTYVRRAYYGGRTEVLEARGSGLHYYDINSSYVAAMRESMPAGERIVESNPLHIDWRRSEKFVGFAECDVEIPPDCHLPPLPHRAEKTGKLIFPAGRFHGVWDLDELRLLSHEKVQGKILRVDKIVWFKRKFLFKEMVDVLWALRDPELQSQITGDPKFDKGLADLAKLMGNSLYGKFGMKEERTQIVFRQTLTEEDQCFLCLQTTATPGGLCRDCEGSKPATGDPECDVWYQRRRVDAPYIIPQISAHITALARVRIWRFLMRAHELGGKLMYGDSVTGDRTTVLKDPHGKVTIHTLEELWQKAEHHSADRGKEFATLDGWEALSHVGWKPIEQILRHSSGKETHLISTKRGQTQVTTDHGIMVDGTPTTPEKFVEEKAMFTQVHVPEVSLVKKIDIFDELFTFEHRMMVKKARGHEPKEEIYRFEADEKHVFMQTSWNERRGIKPLRVKRFYKEGSPEREALMRLVGAYVCDGSASIKGVTTNSRFMLSFCKEDLQLMNQIATDLRTIVPGVEIFGPYWSDTVYIVRSGTIMMACLFAALMGAKSRAKKLPSFAFHLNDDDRRVLIKALENGDGYIDTAGQLCYTTNSQKLAAGVSLLLRQAGKDHSFWFRKEKQAWSIRTRPEGSERRRYQINHEKFPPKKDEYVYDLSIQGAHTFVDGLGQVLLHNTDSIITTIELPKADPKNCDECRAMGFCLEHPVGKKLGALKDEYPGKELDGLFLQPKVYEIKESMPSVLRRAEERYRQAWSEPKLARVRYDMNEPRRDEVREGAKKLPQITMKGFPRDVRTSENLVKLQQGETIKFERLEKVRSLARKHFDPSPQMAPVKKSFKGSYDKRIMRADGTTVPLVLDELDREEAAE